MLSIFTMSNTEFFVNLCEVQLKTDCSAIFKTRIIFSKGAVQQLIEESGLTFAPSVQQSRTCSIPLSNDDRLGSRSLARQKHWQIRTSFTTLLLYNYNLNLDYEDYSKNILEFLTYLSSL